MHKKIQMKIGNIPFSIVFLSSLFPLLGALLNINIYHMPAGLVFIAVVLVLTLNAQKKFLVNNNNLITFALSVLFVILVIQFVTGRGFVTLATGGYVLIFTLVFFIFFSKGTGSSPMSIVRGIGFLYKFFLVTMLIETVFIMLGLQPQLYSIFSSSISPGYKGHNSADILRYFGLMQQSGGLNSILLGSQIAGMLSLFSTIWFIGIRKLKPNGLAINSSDAWIVISILVLLITINGTIFLLFSLACGVYFLYFSKMNRVNKLLMLGLFVMGVYFLIVNELILSRVFNTRLVHLQPDDIELSRKYGVLDEIEGLTTMGYYIFQFLSPIINWLTESWNNKLLGVGKQYFLNDIHFVAGDFGLGIGMLSSGAIWISIFLFSVIGTCIPSLKKTNIKSNDIQIWSALGSINALITLLWLASTIHYNQAYANAGGMTFFALHFSVTIYCRYRYYLYRKNSIRIIKHIHDAENLETGTS